MNDKRKTINDLVDEYLLKHPDKNEAETLVRISSWIHYYEIIRPQMKFWWNMGIKTNLN